jgi:GT2 family glycosyltransferase
MPPLLDIVIPVYGQATLLKQCLGALSLDPKVNVIIVDDASPNRGEMFDLYNHPMYINHIKVVKHDKNKGFAQTVNDGVAKGKAPLILLLNSDVILETTAIDAMILELDDPEVGVVGALLTFPEDSRWDYPGMVQHAGMAFDVTGKPFHPRLGWRPDNPRVLQRNDKLQCVTGACLMTRRNLWNEVGGMNKIYGKGTFEDTEYCLQMKHRKLKVVYTPEAKGIHYTGASIVGAKESYPLAENFLKFRQRCNPFWDEYKVW